MAFASVGTYRTASGTACTIYESANGADKLQLIVPDARRNATGLRGVMWLHGSQGEYNQMMTISSLAGLRDAILDTGGFIAQARGSKTSQFNGLNGWGRDSAKQAYSELAQLAAAFLSVADWVIIGRSMGGAVGKWLATQDSYLAAKTAGYVDMSGIYSFLDEYDDGNHFDLPSWYGTAESSASPPARPDPAPDYSDPAWAAWRSSLSSWKANSSTVAARASLSNATPTNDPARFAPSVWSGKKVLVVYGTKDTTAYPPICGQKFWADNNAQFAAGSAIKAVVGATHAQSNGTYDSPEVIAFIKQVWGVTPVVPKYPGEVTEAWVLKGGRLVPVARPIR